jgi:hypothetical protein
MYEGALQAKGGNLGILRIRRLYEKSGVVGKVGFVAEW